MSKFKHTWFQLIKFKHVFSTHFLIVFVTIVSVVSQYTGVPGIIEPGLDCIIKDLISELISTNHKGLATKLFLKCNWRFCRFTGEIFKILL